MLNDGYAEHIVKAKTPASVTCGMAAGIVLMIAGLGVLALLSRLAALTRMTIPLLYTVSMLTVFHGWYRAHTVLADRILFALVGLVMLSWLLSLIRFVCDLVMQARDDAAAMEYFSYRVRKARENGEDTVSTEGLWR